MAINPTTFKYFLRESIEIDGEIQNIVTTSSILNVTAIDHRFITVNGNSNQYTSSIDNFIPIVKFNEYASAGTYPSLKVKYVRITNKGSNSINLKLSGSATGSDINTLLNAGDTFQLNNTFLSQSALFDPTLGTWDWDNLTGIYAEVSGSSPLNLETGSRVSTDVEYVVVTVQ
jgi:hypothetical protein